MNWLDWLIAVLIVWSAVQGLRRGLLLSLAKTAGLLIGLYVAWIYHRQIAEYIIMHWQFAELIAPITAPLLKLWQPATEVISVSSGMSGAQIAEQINWVIAYNILKGVSFLALLIVTSCLAGIAGSLLTGLANVSFLGPVNHLGGLFFGVFKGMLYVLILLLFGDTVQGIFPSNHAFQESTLLIYFQPLMDLLVTSMPQDIPIKDMLPDPARGTSI